MFFPEIEQVQKLAKAYSIVPVSFEAYADTETPISIFKCLCRNDCCFLLESVEGGEKWGRYSFIGRNPFLIVKGSGNRTELLYRGGNYEILENNPFEVMKQLMPKYSGAPVKGLPRFNGGAVGFFGSTYATETFFRLCSHRDCGSTQNVSRSMPTVL